MIAAPVVYPDLYDLAGVYVLAGWSRKATSEYYIKNLNRLYCIITYNMLI